MPLGANSRMNASLTSLGWISQIHVRLAHAARDQLRDLRAEVEDQDLVVHVHGRRSVVGSGGVGAAALRALKWRSAISSAAACSSGAEVERRADAPVAARQVRHDAPAAARRSPARPPPSGCSATPTAPIVRPCVVASAALEMMLCIAAATAKPSTLPTITAYIIQPSVASAPGEVGTASTRPGPATASRCGEKRLQQRAEQHALHQRRHEADREQRPAVLRRPPAELEGGVEHPGGVQHELRQAGAGRSPRTSEPTPLSSRQARAAQRPDWPRARRTAGAARAAATRAARSSRRARFSSASAAGDEERQVQVDVAEQAAHHRAEDEAHAEHRAEQAEALGALLPAR